MMPFDQVAAGKDCWWRLKLADQQEDATAPGSPNQVRAQSRPEKKIKSDYSSELNGIKRCACHGTGADIEAHAPQADGINVVVKTGRIAALMRDAFDVPLVEVDLGSVDAGIRGPSQQVRWLAAGAPAACPKKARRPGNGFALGGSVSPGQQLRPRSWRGLASASLESSLSTGQEVQRQLSSSDVLAQVMQAYLGLRLAVWSFNVPVQHWEPVIEPWDGIVKCDANFGSKARANNVLCCEVLCCAAM